MAAKVFVVERKRDGVSVSVDARGAVEGAALSLHGPDSEARLSLVVRHDASGAGRPEDVVSALGFEPHSVVRRAIGLEGEAWPRIG
jgi:hypothetical protein